MAAIAERTVPMLAMGAVSPMAGNGWACMVLFTSVLVDNFYVHTAYANRKVTLD